MLAPVLVVIGYLAVVSSAYDFSDAAFNQYLSAQMKDWSEVERVRRSADEGSDDNAEEDGKNSSCKGRPHKGGPIHWRSCCGNGTWMKNFGGKDPATIAKCVKDYMDDQDQNATDPMDFMDSLDDMFSCARVNKKKMKAVCISECAGKKIGLLTEDGHLKAQNVRTYVVNDFFQEDWSRSIAEGVVDKCLQGTNSTTTKTADSGDVKCNPEMLSFVHCLWTHIEKNCPEFQRKQDPKCKEFFQKMEASKKSTDTSRN